jgi:hypothetical protein
VLSTALRWDRRATHLRPSAPAQMLFRPGVRRSPQTRKSATRSPYANLAELRRMRRRLTTATPNKMDVTRTKLIAGRIAGSLSPRSPARLSRSPLTPILFTELATSQPRTALRRSSAPRPISRRDGSIHMNPCANRGAKRKALARASVCGDSPAVMTRRTPRGRPCLQRGRARIPACSSGASERARPCG